MKMNEIASAEEQLALLRVIFDNAWQALKQQSEQQRQMQAKAKSKPKVKPRKAQRDLPPIPVPI